MRIWIWTLTVRKHYIRKSISWQRMNSNSWLLISGWWKSANGRQWTKNIMITGTVRFAAWNVSAKKVTSLPTGTKHFGWTMRLPSFLSFRLSTTIIFSSGRKRLTPSTRFRRMKHWQIPISCFIIIISRARLHWWKQIIRKKESFVSSTSFTIHGGQPFKVRTLISKGMVCKDWLIWWFLLPISSFIG